MNSHMRFLPHGLRALAVALLVLATSCASSNPYVENRDLLDKAEKSFEQGNYQAAAQQAESLFAGRSEQAAKFQLQRYYAAYLCAEAHTQAALHKPFLTQAAATGAGLGISASSQGSDSTVVPSATAHWVAASYYAGFAKDTFALAAKEPQQQAGQELLPSGLKQVSLERAQANLNLTRLAILRRMGFEAECAAVLDASAEMLDVAKCEAILEQAQLAKELRPLIFYAGFAHMKLRANPTDMRSQATTYHLGAQARLLADETQDSLPRIFTDDVIRWVEENKNFEFQCKCNKKFQPTSLRCPVCSSSIVQFKVSAKAPGSP